MSDLIYNFAQTAHQRQPLSQIGAGIANVVTQKRAAEAERQRLAKYNGLLSQFKETGDYNLFLDMQNVAPEKFEGFMKAWEPMDHMQKQQTAKQYGDILGQLDAGNTDLAAEDMENIALALESEGNTDEANKWRKMLRALDPMNPDQQNPEAVKTMLTAYLASGGEEGLAVLEGRESVAEGLRKDEAHVINLLESGVGLEYNSPEHRNWVGMLAAQMSNPELATLIADMGGIATELGGASGMDANDLFNATSRTKEKFNALVTPYKEIVHNTKILHDLGQADTGFADTAMISLYNKVLDPDSVVRESEVRNTVASIGKWEEIKMLYAKLAEGEQLPPGGREKLLEASRLISKQAETKIESLKDEYRPLMSHFGIAERDVFGDDSGQAQDYSFFEKKDAMRDYALSQGVDPTTEQGKKFFDALDNTTTDEELRAIGDGGLYRLGEPVAPTASEPKAQEAQVKATLSKVLAERGADQAFIDNFNKLSLNQIMKQYETLYNQYFGKQAPATSSGASVDEDIVDWG